LRIRAWIDLSVDQYQMPAGSDDVPPENAFLGGPFSRSTSIRPMRARKKLEAQQQEAQSHTSSFA
jgi:hypothetical protein